MTAEVKPPEDEFGLPTIDSELPEISKGLESSSGELDREASKAIALEQGTPQFNPPGGAVGVPTSLPQADLHTIPPTNTHSGLSGTTPLVADDGDLIEKEWVAKAKQIVERTKGDPFTQSKEISLVKVDYLKKRYNKDLEVSS